MRGVSQRLTLLPHRLAQPLSGLPLLDIGVAQSLIDLAQLAGLSEQMGLDGFRVRQARLRESGRGFLLAQVAKDGRHLLGLEEDPDHLALLVPQRGGGDVPVVLLELPRPAGNLDVVAVHRQQVGLTRGQHPLQ